MKWRDDQLPAHRSYSEVIEERLDTARAVVVVWSAEAAMSQWVQSEADRAREAGKLVQLRLDDVRLPMPFDRIQCADMIAWPATPTHPAGSR
jgi:adenylate cyclase